VKTRNLLTIPAVSYNEKYKTWLIVGHLCYVQHMHACIHVYIHMYIHTYLHTMYIHVCIPHTWSTVKQESLAGQKFGEFTRFEHLAKKVWRMNRFSQKVINVSINLDGYSLANQGWFAKFTKPSSNQTFSPYGI